MHSIIEVLVIPTIVHFDLPADDTDRARQFYEKLFDWKFNKVPMPAPFYLIETKDLDGRTIISGSGRKIRTQSDFFNDIP